MTVTQTDPKLLERFREAVGTGYIYGPLSRASRPAHHKPCYSFRVSKRDETIDCLLKLWPYLSNPKRAQALNALDQCIERLDLALDAHENGPCRQGHPVEFTIFDKRGFRSCRLCKAAWKRNHPRGAVAK